MVDYRIIKDNFCGVETQYLFRTNSDGSQTNIPFAEGNTDYQKYLAWLAEGNEPLPADN